MNFSTTGAIVFSATSTGKTIDTAGKSMASSSIIANGSGGGWTQLSAITTGSFSHGGGSWDTDDYPLTLSSSFSSAGSTARTLDLGASSISCTTVTLSGSNLTWVEGTSHITSSSSSSSAMEFGTSRSFYDLTLTDNSNAVTGPWVWAAGGHNLTRTNTSAYCSMILQQSMTISNDFTVTGANSHSARIYVGVSTQNTSITLTVNGTVSCTNADFWCIEGAGSASWDLSANSSGDRGLNSGITFTTPVTKYWIGGTGNWSATGEWSNSSGGSSSGDIPLPQDNIVFDANSFSAGSQTVTVDITNLYLGNNIDWTSATNSPTWTRNVAHRIGGSVTLISSMTHNHTGVCTFQPNTSQTAVYTSAGKTSAGQMTIQGAGTLQFADNYESTGSITHQGSTLELNGQTVKISTFNSSNSLVRTITSSSSGGILEVTGTGTVFTISSATNLTISNHSNWSIKLSNATGTARTVTGNSSYDLGHLLITAGTGNVTLGNVRAQSWNFTGYTGAIQTGAQTVYGDITISGNTFASGTGVLTLAGGNANINFNSVAINRPITVNTTGTKTLTGHLDMDGASSRVLTLTAGTITGSYTWTAGSLTNTGTGTRAITGNLKVKVVGTGTVVNSSGSNFSMDNTATIEIANNSTSSKTFAGGGYTYGIFHVNTQNTGQTIITGSNTFYQINIGTTNTRILHFTAGTTTTFNASGDGIVILGGTGHSFRSVTNATHTLTKSSGTVSVSNCTITYSIATGGATWNALTTDDNVDGGNNTGWVFSSSTTYTLDKDIKARIKATLQLTKSIKSRLLRTQQLTKGAKGLIKVAGNTVNKTSKAFVTLGSVTLTKDLNARILVQQSTTKQAKANIKATVSTNKTAKASLRKEGILVTETLKARVKKGQATTKTATARVLIQNTTTKETKARILKTQSTTKQSKANIKATVQTTKQSKASVRRERITVTKGLNASVKKTLQTNKTTTARIKIPKTATKQTKARIKKDSSTTKTAKARITKPQQVTKEANARLVKTQSVNKSSKATVKATVQTTKNTKGRVKIDGNEVEKTAKAMVNISYTLNKNANARIKVTQSTTKSSKATVRREGITLTKGLNASVSTSLGVHKTVNARIIVGKSLTKQSKARIEVRETLTKEAKARIKAPTTTSKQSKARIKVTGQSKVKLAKARVVVPNTQGNYFLTARVKKGANTLTKTSKANIKKTQQTTETSKARIKRNQSITEQIKARVKKRYITTKTAKASVAVRSTVNKFLKANIKATVTITKSSRARIRIEGFEQSFKKVTGRLVGPKIRGRFAPKEVRGRLVGPKIRGAGV
jgi:hypothetical protein